MGVGVSRLPWIIFVPLAITCTPQTPTQIFLHADADPITIERAAFLRATITNQEGEVRLQHEFPLRGATAHDWPIDLSILPQGNDGSRIVSVQVEALDPSLSVFNERTGRYSFVPHSLFEATIFLQDSCIGVVCDPGNTCQRGTCVPIDEIPVATRSEDDQQGVCSSRACWEHPRPAGQGANAVCAWDESGAAAIGGAVVWLEDDLWVPDPVWEDRALRALACWAPRSGVAMTNDRVAIRTPEAWRDVALPEGTTELTALWAEAADEIWVAGVAGLVLRFNGAVWERPAGLAPLTADVRGVAADDETVWLVGEGFVVAYRRDSDIVEPLDTPPDAAGATGVHYSEHEGVRYWKTNRQLFVHDGSWQPPYEGHLDFGIISTSFTDGYLYAGGGRGQFDRQLPGGAWIPLPAFGQALIRDLAGVADDVFAVGENGNIGVFRRDRWFHRGVQLSNRILHSVAADPSASAHYVAVGDGGLILERVAEGIWRRRVATDESSEPVRASLRSVVAAPSGFWAAGEDGVVIHSDDGERWDLQRRTGNFRSVCIAGDQLLVVGDAGLAWTHAPDGTWSDRTIGSADWVSCTGLADGSWLVAGSSGELFRLDDVSAALATFTPPITQLVRDESALLVVADGSVFELDSEGSCPAPCMPLDAPSGVERVLVRGGQPSWYLGRTTATPAEGQQYLGSTVLNAIAALDDADDAVLVIGEGAVVVRVDAR